LKELEKLLFDYNRENLVKEDFDDIVFKKINRKKNIRRVNYSVFSVILLLVSILVIQNIIPTSDNKSHFANNNKLTEKEEIPLVEDFYFSAVDESANFTIEQVSYTDEEGVIY